MEGKMMDKPVGKLKEMLKEIQKDCTDYRKKEK